jgi:hypothetical protein
MTDARLDAALFARPWRTARSLTASVVLLAVTLLATVGCDGGSPGADASLVSASGPTLVGVQVGRLVDIYAWRRVDESQANRMDATLRRRALIARDVLIRSDIKTEPLDFDLGCLDGPDPIGSQASFRFLPFDIDVGHEELLILWDDQRESECFDLALARATTGIDSLTPAFVGQNPVFQPFPIVPRNAAIRLVFDRPLGVASNFFASNPEAVQLLTIQGDVNAVGAAALSPLPVRIIAKENEVILDPSIVGGEAASVGFATPGLPPSPDSSAANIRIAIPTQGPGADVLNVASDRNGNLNDVDALGNPAVVRDFRSANVGDGNDVLLPDRQAPQVVGLFEVGIRAVDPEKRRLRLTKRGQNVAIRGRIPFVDGQRSLTDGVPGGSTTVPTTKENGDPEPLVAGDRIAQQVILPQSGRAVTVKAEVLEVLSVDRRGLTPIGTDGGTIDEIEVIVSETDFLVDGEAVSFEAEESAAGSSAIATVRYYENVPYRDLPGIAVSDFSRRSAFLEARPASAQIGSVVKDFDPSATVIVRFSEPLDLETVSSLDNIVITTATVGEQTLKDDIQDPKRFGLSVVPTRLVDIRGDATEIELIPPLGVAHENGLRESYWIHLVGDGIEPIRDLAGNALDVWDRRPINTAFNLPRTSLSIELQLDLDAPSNEVAWKTIRFASADEDGTSIDAAAPDWFGQGELANGRLFGAPANRRRLTADSNNLGAISRANHGECVNAIIQEDQSIAEHFIAGIGIDPRIGAVPARVKSGFLYDVPRMTVTVSGPPMTYIYTFGGVVEPHTRFGARQQMTYRSDDFSLSDNEPEDFNIDVEQLYWSPWAGTALFFDVFERYSVRLSHVDKRADVRFQTILGDRSVLPPIDPSPCFVDCFSPASGLDTAFSANVLASTQAKTVVLDNEYRINPATSFVVNNVRYVNYPEFEDTYTWRDSRLVSWDAGTQTATGLGGSRDGSTPTDLTSNVSSPWVPNDPSNSLIGEIPAVLVQQLQGVEQNDADGDGRLFEGFNQDPDDFLGDRTRDHDPIALPLLVDLWVYPDDITSSVANAGNLFQIAFSGPPYIASPDPQNGYNPMNGADAGGYYGFGTGPCGFQNFANFRVHATGGFNPVTQSPVTVNPAQAQAATGGLVVDIGLPGSPTPVPPGDSHTNWAAMDVVRRVSMLTYGFFDTLAPNRNALGGTFPQGGLPNFEGIGTGAGDIVFLRDRQLTPGATRVLVEVRGLEDADNIGTLYDPQMDDSVGGRGNLLNPNYSCEAFRHASANPGFGGSGPRVNATGITPYVDLDLVDDLRNEQSGLLPRYLNLRFVLENDIAGAETLRPSLGGFSATWRVQ